MAIRSIGSVALLAATLLACGGGDRAARAGAGDTSAAGGARAAGTGADLTGAGATFPNPIYTKWFDAYAKQTGVRINYQSIGSGGGIRQFTEGTVDFGATDGPMSDQQIAAVKGNVLHIPTVLGAVVVTYNLPSLGATKLKFDGATIADIFLGTITKWNDPKIAAPNPGVKLPDQDIIVVHRSDGSGTSFIFTDFLSKVSPEWKSKVGSATSVQLADRAGRQGQRGRHPAGQAVRGSDRLRRADLRHLQQAAVRGGEERGRQVRRAQPQERERGGRGRGPQARDRFPGVDHQRAGCRGLPDFVVHLAAGAEGQSGCGRGRKDPGFPDLDAQPEAQRMAADLHYAPLPVPVIELVQKRIPG